MSSSTGDVLNTTFIDITQINFLLAECYALNKAIENPALPPRVILAEIDNKYVYRANDVFTHRAIEPRQS